MEGRAQRRRLKAWRQEGVATASSAQHHRGDGPASSLGHVSIGREQRAENREQKAENREQRAGGHAVD